MTRMKEIQNINLPRPTNNKKIIKVIFVDYLKISGNCNPEITPPHVWNYQLQFSTLHLNICISLTMMPSGGNNLRKIISEIMIQDGRNIWPSVTNRSVTPIFVENIPIERHILLPISAFFGDEELGLDCFPLCFSLHSFSSLTDHWDKTNTITIEILFWGYF